MKRPTPRERLTHAFNALMRATFDYHDLAGSDDASNEDVRLAHSAKNRAAIILQNEEMAYARHVREARTQRKTAADLDE